VTTTKIVGTRKYTYEVDGDWAKLPEGWEMPAVAVAGDSQDRIYCFNRDPDHPVIVFDREGNYLSSWGAGLIAFAHAILLDPKDNVWLVDRNNHQVMKFNPDGEHLLFGGQPGTGPGEFNCPHGVWIDRNGRVLVTDRENDRVQVFTQEGAHLETWQTQLIDPALFFVDDEGTMYIPEHNAGLIRILSLHGELLAQRGSMDHHSCHSIWVDSHKDLYVVMPGDWGRTRRAVKYIRQG
jgi:DNA-binding beta-propeller fold protein YncE